MQDLDEELESEVTRQEMVRLKREVLTLRKKQQRLSLEAQARGAAVVAAVHLKDEEHAETMASAVANAEKAAFAQAARVAQTPFQRRAEVLEAAVKDLQGALRTEQAKKEQATTAYQAVTKLLQENRGSR